MSKEFDKEVSRLLHTVTYALNDFVEAEKEYYKAKKIFHDRFTGIKTKLIIVKEEILELVLIKSKENGIKEK